MAAPIVYRWDDGNAPIARGERRSLCDILHACLVTGYGAKPGAGWTREYVNATFDKAVFRNNPLTGTGMFLQVDGAGSSIANASLCRAFEVMTDVDTGLFPFRAADLVATSSATGTTARPWVLIADDRAFYFICWTAVTSLSSTSIHAVALYFGDFVSRHSVDPYACVIGASQANQTNMPVWPTILSPSAVNGQSLAVARPISGVATPYLAALIRGGGPGDDSYPGRNGVVYSPGDQILITRPHINNGATYSFRGFLPGYYYPCHTPYFGQLATITVNGKNYLSLRGLLNQAAVEGGIFILLDDWRA